MLAVLMKPGFKKIVWIIITILVIFSGLLVINLTREKNSSDKYSRLETIISSFAGKSSGDCVLSVMKGDGSFSWTCSSGHATNQNNEVLANEIPVFISSVTKLYTATVMMKLFEMNLLSLDDTISKYLQLDLIKGIQVYNGRDYSNQITIKELLAHTSGIADYYTEKSKGGRSLFEIIISNPDRTWTIDETIERARDSLKSHFEPGMGTYYSDTNYQLLGKIIEKVTQKPLYMVYEDFIFKPLGLRHTWLIGSTENQTASSEPPADIFYKNEVITRTRSNGAYWADGGIVSTAPEMIIFLKALNEGKIVSKGTLVLMHNWHKWRFPIRYGFGTMYFKLPPLMTKISNLTPLWGHSGSTGSFLYFSEDLDLYMAGSLNEVGSDVKPFKLMSGVMKIFSSK
jgi:D-alanyl-D-alanine carboxypeptidase